MKKRSNKSINTESINIATHMPARLDRLSNRLEAYSSRTYVARFGIGIRGWKVLSAVGRYGSLTINEIADYHGTVQSSISRAVQGLVKDGLVITAKSNTDGRRVVVALTKKGHEIHTAIVPLSRLRAEEILHAFTPQDRRNFDRLLTILENKIRDMVETDWDSKALDELARKAGRARR